MALSYQAENLGLSRGESHRFKRSVAVPSVLARSRLARYGLNERWQARLDNSVARADELVVCHRLEHVAMRAGFLSVSDVLCVVVNREHEYSSSRATLAYLACRL